MLRGRSESVDGEERPAGTTGEWPLVGRDSDVEAARSSLHDRRGIVLVGEPGTGKTRLAAEVVSATTADGLRWHVVIGSQGAARVPLGAWSHLLPDTWEPGADDLATWRLLATGLEASDGAIHLFVDDAQWLDPVSAGLVHHLVTSGQAKAVVTLRRHEGVGQPITALWKDGHLDRHDLEVLGPRDTEAVLEAALAAPVEPGTARRLHERSAGNLLMLRELVDAGRLDGTLQLRHGAWVQRDTNRPGARLVDLLADRIDDLAPDERAGAELVAVAEPIDADLLAQALPPDLVQALIARRLVEVDRVGDHRVVRSSHPLMAEVLVDRMDAARRGAVVSALVDLFEHAGSSSDADLVRIAVWRLDIGLPIEGPDALRAAELALARSDFPLAEELAVVARDADQGPVAMILLGEALHRQQRHAEADAVLGEVSGHLAELEPWVRVRYAQERALALSSDLGRLDDAIEVLESTIDTMPEGRPRWALEARLAFVLADCGRLRAAEPLADARLAGIEEDEVSALSALTAFATIRTLSGRGRDALAACDAVLPIAMGHLDDVPSGIGWIAAQRMLAQYFLGDLEAAADFSAAVDAMVADDVDTTRRAAVLMVRGMIAGEQGRLDEALRFLRLSAALHDLDNRRGYQSWTMAITSRVQAQRGDLDAADAALVQAQQMRWPGGQVFDSELESAAVWLHALRGRRTEAVDLLDAAIARADAQGMVIVAANLRHEAIRAGHDPAPHVAPLAAFAAIDQGRRGAVWHAHAAALAADDGAGLVEAGHRLADLGTHLVAAEAFARAAPAHRRAGSPSLAAQAKVLSRQERDLCSGARTPALHFDHAVVGLTTREVDVASRAAEGRTNLDIADELGISVRTVETHLQRVFVKLGVNRRTDLASVMQLG